MWVSNLLAVVVRVDPIVIFALARVRDQGALGVGLGR